MLSTYIFFRKVIKLCAALQLFVSYRVNREKTYQRCWKQCWRLVATWKHCIINSKKYAVQE